MKYIDAEKLIAEIERRKAILNKYKDSFETAACCKQELEWMKDFITSLQQDKETLMLEMWNQSFWEDSGYIMIPPDVTIEGIESLLKQVKKKLQQEQPEVDLKEESYMRGFAQGAKEEREGLSPTMLTYAADVFGGKTLLEDISYSYRQELADYFRDLTKTAQEE